MQQLLTEAYHWRLVHEAMHFLSGLAGSFLGTYLYFKWAQLRQRVDSRES